MTCVGDVVLSSSLGRGGSLCLSLSLSFFSRFDELKAKQERATEGDRLTAFGAFTSCWELLVAKQRTVSERYPSSPNVFLISQYKIRSELKLKFAA